MKKILCLLLALFSLAGCSLGGNSGGNKEVETIKGTISIPENPQRIVDLSGNSDMLSILGFNVVGTTNADAYDYTKYPSYLEDQLQGAEILGYSQYATPDIEQVLALEPDLIFISSLQDDSYDQLSEIAPTVELKLDDLNWRENFKNVAKILGKEDEAQKWIEAYDIKAKEMGEKIKADNSDTDYLVLLASGGSLFVLDQAGLGGVIYDDMGLARPENMPRQNGVELPVISYEGLSAINPDEIIVVGTEEDTNALKANAIYNNMEAVQSGDVLYLSSSPYFDQGYSVIGRELLIDEIGNKLLNEE